jgi:hypothetical protein
VATILNFYFLKKIQKKIFFFFLEKKKKKNPGVAMVTLLGTKGWLGHPHGAKGVVETTPKPPLGVVSATPMGPGGGRNGWFQPPS